jgi:hypothetical protein
MGDEMEIPALSEAALHSICESQGLADSIDAGKSRCIICKETVDWSTIGGLVVQNENEISVLCNKPECLDSHLKGSHGGY